MENSFSKKTNSKIFCCVFGCNSKACRNPDISFHHFPKAGQIKVQYENKFGEIELIDRRKLWEKVLRMGKKITNSMRVCSLHFKQEDYSYFSEHGYPTKAKYLKTTSFPTINLPNSTVKIFVNKNKALERKIRFEKRQQNKLGKEKNKSSCILTEECAPEANSVNDSGTLDEHRIDALDQEEFIAEGTEKELIQDFEDKMYVDVGIQVQSGDIIGSHFLDFLNNDDKKLSTATDIQSFELFESIVAAVKLAVPQLDKKPGVLSVRERIILTCMKLKQNLSYSNLSILFPTVSTRYCPELICNMLDILNEVLKPCIHFPSSAEILKNMPLCFSKYKNTRIILDCTEIEIQHPKNLCSQIKTYSSYKGRNIIKFMTGVTPGGVISFVSRCYGGRASGKSIFEQSLLLSKLEKGSAIMVDKGFLIDDLCNDYGIKLIRPPFLKNQTQFSAEDALENADIASARVHVERLNQRLKVFEILGGKIPSCMVRKSEKIMNILCAVVNLSSPIFKDDKFFS